MNSMLEYKGHHASVAFIKSIKKGCGKNLPHPCFMNITAFSLKLIAAVVPAATAAAVIIAATVTAVAEAIISAAAEQKDEDDQDDDAAAIATKTGIAHRIAHGKVLL